MLLKIKILNYKSNFSKFLEKSWHILSVSEEYKDFQTLTVLETGFTLEIGFTSNHKNIYR